MVYENSDWQVFLLWVSIFFLTLSLERTLNFFFGRKLAVLFTGLLFVSICIAEGLMISSHHQWFVWIVITNSVVAAIPFIVYAIIRELILWKRVDALGCDGE